MSAAAADNDTVSALDGIVSVSRETENRLERFVAVLRKWQATENLIAPRSAPAIWRRHVADSAQLVRFFPDVRVWLDLGSGAGFPGLVTAILLAHQPGAHVHLIESNGRKCAFLRQVIRDTGAAAEVHQGRIEQLVDDWAAPIDMISARGLAPLKRLFLLTEPLFSAGASGAFHKGQDFVREIAETAKSWDCDLIKYKSLIDPQGVILTVGNLRRKASSPTGSRGRP